MSLYVVDRQTGSVGSHHIRFINAILPNCVYLSGVERYRVSISSTENICKLHRVL